MGQNTNTDSNTSTNIFSKFFSLIRLKLKFATSSLVATIADLILFHLLTEHFAWNPVYANIVSAFLGMVINFILQKQFIFILRRKLRTAFLISFVTSIIGISISTAIVYAFTKNNILFYPFDQVPLIVENYQFLVKLFATGIVFFYNFYMKRFAFEKRFVE